MSKSMNLIFEPMDLQAASPATVSRNGMVYMEPGSMGWQILYHSWKASIPSHFVEVDKELIETLFMWTVDPVLEFIRNSVKEISPTQNQTLVLALMRYFGAQLKELFDPEHYALYTDMKQRFQLIEGKFLFSLIWALGGSATTESRKIIDAFLKKLLNGDIKIPDFEKKKLPMPERGSLFDYNFVLKKGSAPGGPFEWVQWVDFIDLTEKIPSKIQPQ